MAQRFVPVSMGSPRYKTVQLDGMTVTDAWFPPYTRIPAHVHERPCFAVMLDGAFDLEFPARTYECPPTTVLTEPAGERHANRILREGARVVVLQPDPARAERWRPLADLLERTHHLRHAGVAGLARRLSSEIQSPDTVSDLAIESLSLEMLVGVNRFRSTSLKGRRAPRWLERSAEFLHAHFRDKLTTAQVAGAAGVHPVHLSRVFRQHYNSSIGDYVRGLRLDWAADRLARTDEPLCDIAVRAGFADQSHFTRDFKRRTGETPGRYRTSKQNGSRGRQRGRPTAPASDHPAT